MNRMFNPPHPGETIREDVLPEMGLTITEAAKQIGVSRVALSRVLKHGSVLKMAVVLMPGLASK